MSTSFEYLEWFSVSERLPERGERVLAVTNGEPFVATYFGYGHCTEWASDDHWLVDDDANITYWMPLPEQPEISRQILAPEKRIAELEADTTNLLAQLRSKALNEDILKLHIAELEAELAELKPYRYGYDPAKKLPDEGSVVLAYVPPESIVLVHRRKGKWWTFTGIQIDVDWDIKRWWNIPKFPEDCNER